MGIKLTKAAKATLDRDYWRIASALKVLIESAQKTDEAWTLFENIKHAMILCGQLQTLEEINGITNTVDWMELNEAVRRLQNKLKIVFA